MLEIMKICSLIRFPVASLNKEAKYAISGIFAVPLNRI